jgi:hypothetical protein
VLTTTNNFANGINNNNNSSDAAKTGKESAKPNKPQPTNGGGIIEDKLAPKSPLPMATPLMPPVVNFPMILQVSILKNLYFIGIIFGFFPFFSNFRRSFDPNISKEINIKLRTKLYAVHFECQ